MTNSIQFLYTIILIKDSYFYREINSAVYERICQETLDSLCEYFEDIVEKYPVFKTADVAFGVSIFSLNNINNFVQIQLINCFVLFVMTRTGS